VKIEEQRDKMHRMTSSKEVLEVKRTTKSRYQPLFMMNVFLMAAVYLHRIISIKGRCTGE